MNIFLDANICLDLLDSNRQNSTCSIAWYMQNKDIPTWNFYFSGDFITTLLYAHRKEESKPDLVIEATNQLCIEVTPIYLIHQDFLLAQQVFCRRFS